MTTFQQTALLLTAIWLVLVLVVFRRSRLVLIGGLVAIGSYTLVAYILGKVTLDELGLDIPSSWIPTIVLSFVWLGLMLAYSPIADRLAARWFSKPPTLEAFGVIQQSRAKLIAGILVAWVFGGILEELIARGIVLQSVKVLLAAWFPVPLAVALAVSIAAIGAGLLHSYQGPRALVIITQLSLLFGLLFVISGYNLWPVILCHGLYDTIALVRFANNQSTYSHLDTEF